MSFQQTIAVRNGTSSLDVASNQTTGNLSLCPIQTSGECSIGTGTARSGSIQIGNDASGGSTSVQGANVFVVAFAQADVAGGTVNIAATTQADISGANIDIAATTQTDISGANIDLLSTGNSTFKSSAGALTIEGTTGTYLGSQTVNSNTFIADEATSADIVVGIKQTSGDLNLGTGAVRSGAITIGNETSSGGTNVRGSNVNILAPGNSTFKSTTGTIEIEGGLSTYLGSQSTAASNTYIANSATTGIVEVGANQTTGVITIGTGAARSGAITIGNVSSSGATIVGGNAVNILSTGNAILKTITGTLEVEGGNGTYLGSQTVNSDTFIADESTTTEIGIGKKQTTGTINVGTLSTRTGDINIGNTAASNTVYIKGISMNKRTSRQCTPQIHGSTSGEFTPNLGSSTCWVVEYGDWVHIHCTYVWWNKTGTGGLPVGAIQMRFTGDAIPAQFTAMVNTELKWDNTSGLFSAHSADDRAVIASGQDHVSFYDGNTTMDEGDFVGGGEIQFEGWYMK